MNKTNLTKKQIKVSATSSWVDNFAGKWKDGRSTSQIIKDIHTARTFNSEISMRETSFDTPTTARSCCADWSLTSTIWSIGHGGLIRRFSPRPSSTSCLERSSEEGYSRKELPLSILILSFHLFHQTLNIAPTVDAKSQPPRLLLSIFSQKPFLRALAGF